MLPSALALEVKTSEIKGSKFAPKVPTYVGIKKVNPAFKTKKQVDNEYAKQAVNLWRPMPKKTFAELKAMNDVEKTAHAELLLLKDMQVGQYVDKT